MIKNADTKLLDVLSALERVPNLARVINCVTNISTDLTLAEAIEIGPKEFLQTPNFGKKSFTIIFNAIDAATDGAYTDRWLDREKINRAASQAGPLQLNAIVQILCRMPEDDYKAVLAATRKARRLRQMLAEAFASLVPTEMPFAKALTRTEPSDMYTWNTVEFPK